MAGSRQRLLRTLSSQALSNPIASATHSSISRRTGSKFILGNDSKVCFFRRWKHSRKSVRESEFMAEKSGASRERRVSREKDG